MTSNEQRRRPHYASIIPAAGLALAFACGGAWAAEPCRGSAVQPSFQMPGEAPSAVATVGNRVVLIDDAGAERAIVACELDDAGAFIVKQRWPLPADFSASKLSIRGPLVIVESSDGRTVEQNVSGAPQPESLPAAALSVDGLPFTESKQPDGSLRLTVPLAESTTEAPAPSVEFALAPLLPAARIFTRQVLFRDLAAKFAIVFWDEVGDGTGAFVGKFGADGNLLAGARVPLEDMDTIPEHFLGVLADGRPYYLRVRDTAAEPVLLPLDAAFAANAKPGGPIVEEVRKIWRDAPGSEKRGSLNQPDSAASAESADADLAFEEAVRKLMGAGGQAPEAAAPPVSRGEVLDCAEKFRTLKWTMTPGAYERQGVANDCSPPARYWRRPHYLNESVGHEVMGVPYAWGHSSSIDEFTTAVAGETHLAGHSCTCRSGNYCLRDDVVGVDCSGFVSQCWKSGYYTTSRMSEIADTIRKANLKPGDAFNNAGSHIRMFVGIASTPTGDRYKVVEAANGEGSIGRVVEATYTASKLSSYAAIRYRLIRDEPPAPAPAPAATASTPPVPPDATGSAPSAPAPAAPAPPQP